MKAILFDLDGTLLPMDTDRFMKLYAQEITKAFENFEEKDIIFTQIMKSVGVTVRDQSDKVNYDVFFEDFESKMPRDRQDYISVFDNFYQSNFNRVKEATEVSHDILEAVKVLKAKGYKLIIATNPIFPMAANKARINWAGLDFNDFDYVTSFEENTSCKPNLSFFKEVLEKNSLHAEDVLMVGNDVQEDMCIKALGSKTYLITDHIINRTSSGDLDVDYSGNYRSFLNFVKHLDSI